MQDFYVKNKLYKFDREGFSVGPASRGTKKMRMKKAFPVVLDNGKSFTIPKDFTFDGASFPRFLMLILVVLSVVCALIWPSWITIVIMLCLLFFLYAYTSFSPLYLIAASIHDYCYNEGIVSRVKADEVFADILEIEKNNLARVAIMFGGVRGFGWIGWRKYRKAQAGE